MLDVAWDIEDRLPLPDGGMATWAPPNILSMFVDPLLDQEGQQRSLVGRAGGWPKLEHAHLLKESRCRVCGGKKKLQVHHKLPFSWRPELELVESNLITMCQPHHLLIGHWMLWASYDESVEAKCDELFDCIKHRPLKKAA